MAHEQNKSLIEALNNCAMECNHCATACLNEQDVKMLTTCIQLDIDCADICQVTASLIARNSDHGFHLVKECAEVCESCAKECEKHAHHMDHCKACAEACRKCADECRAVIEQHS